MIGVTHLTRGEPDHGAPRRSRIHPSWEGMVPPEQQEKEMTSKCTIEILGEAALDLVVGGIWDRPETDAANKRRADQNGADGTFGGSIGGGLIPGAGSHGGAIPV